MARKEEKPVQANAKPLWQRLAWLVLIWSLSVGTLAVVAFVLRLIMAAAGLGTPN